MSPPKTHSKSHSFFCFCQTRQWAPDLGQRFCLGPEGKGRGCPWNGWFHRRCSDQSKWWVRPRLRDNKSFCCFCVKIYERLEKEKREKRENWARQKREKLEKQEQREARLRWRMLAVSQDDTNKQMESDASSVTLGREDWPKFRTLRRDSGYESDRLTASRRLQQGIKRRRDSEPAVQRCPEITQEQMRPLYSHGAHTVFIPNYN